MDEIELTYFLNGPVLVSKFLHKNDLYHVYSILSYESILFLFAT